MKILPCLPAIIKLIDDTEARKEHVHTRTSFILVFQGHQIEITFRILIESSVADKIPSPFARNYLNR